LINDESKSIALHVVIGNNYFQNSEYDNAFLYYAMAYSSINCDNLLTAEIFNRLGDVWTALNYHDNAISCFQRAFDFIISDSDKDEKLIEICDKIMKICPKEKYNQYAEKYETKAKEIIDYHTKHCKYIDKKTTLKTHQQFNDKYNPDRLHDAVKLFTEGKTLLQIGNIKEATNKFKQARQMFKEYYSMFDRFGYLLCINYEVQAGAYLGLKDILSALIMWKKSIDIRMSLKRGPE
jgi:tetratricopeptide (TPR) repeat protein